MPVTSINQANNAVPALATGTPGASAVGDSASAGTATTMSRSDHVHGREAFAATPSTQAIGDVAAAGTATTVARGDHKHAMPSFGTPVTADGQTTSLSAGSLTTIARADHVHTLSNVWRKVAETTLGTSSTSVTISSIPTTYKHMMIITTAITSYPGTVDLLCAQFNGDTGNNYYRNQDNATGTSTRLSYLAGNTVTNYTNQMSRTTTYIYDYASTAKYKSADTIWYSPTSTTDYSITVSFYYSIWKNATNPISSITFFSANGYSFYANSTFSIYLA